MSGCDHLSPVQFGQQQCSDDENETEEDRKRRVRDAAREASKARHPAGSALIDDSS